MPDTYVNLTSEYYESKKDPEDFMDDEVTVSHLLRNRNQFTKNKLSFGGQLAKNLEERGLLPHNPKILEIGPGLGDIAEGIGNYLDWNFEYTFLDISTRLIENLKSRFSEMENFHFVRKDCLEIGESPMKFDLVICNELLGDLPTIVNMDRNLLKNAGKAGKKWDGAKTYGLLLLNDSLRMIRKYGLDMTNAPEIFNFNYGALRFVEIAGNILRKNGVFFASEPSSGSGWPEKIPVFGHDEYSIKFDFLKKAARKLGFSVESGLLTDFLGIDRRKKCVSMIIQRELRSIYGFLKEHGRSEILKLGMQALTVGEFIELIKKHRDEISIADLESYEKFLEREAKPLSSITDKFEYVVLRK